MGTTQAWAVIAVGEHRQYGGNRGYIDDVRRIYRYDSQVANHRNIKRGDLVLVRDRTHLLGLALVDTVTSKPGTKRQFRCPECGTTALKARKKKHPTFRCNNGHEFDAPREETVSVMEFEAHYGDTFVEAPGAVSLSQLKAAARRPNDQLSIEEVDPLRLEKEAVSGYPKVRDILLRYFQTESLDALEAEAQTEFRDPSTGNQDPYELSPGDSRMGVLRQIKQRRGQKKFRNDLIRRYGGQCLVTGCAVMDVVEAAHIWPYRGSGDNHPENGLLLRADVHTLFDLNLIVVIPETLRVAIAPPVAADSIYASLAGAPLRIHSHARPSRGALDHRWQVFTDRWPHFVPEG